MIEQLQKPFQILWHEGYYDGPLTGVGLYEDEIYYFSCVEELKPKVITVEENGELFNDVDWGWFRKYNIFKLSDEDKIKLLLFHAIFQTYVGFHCDYYPFNGRAIHALHYGGNGSVTDKNYWDIYSRSLEEFKKKFGTFDPKAERKVIGYIYYNQLFG